MKPNSFYELDFGAEVQEDWKRIRALKIDETDWSEYTAEELALIEKYDVEMKGDLWNVMEGGCSYYCGAGQYEVETSSYLASNRGLNYTSENLTDFSYETAWVEGKEDYGIGESIRFEFVATHPRVTTIIIVNGYVKSDDLWKKNSRVKSLQMYIDDVPHAILMLKDANDEQVFKFDPIGHSEREDTEKLSQMPPFSIRFEILEVYKGDKYTDTAITEIYFDGIDVH